MAGTLGRAGSGLGQAWLGLARFGRHGCRKGSEMVYRWKDGARVPAGSDPQIIGDEIERLRTRSGGLLTAKHILKAAKAKRSPLHPHFEWDDTAAAEKYRQAQASYLLRVVVVAAAEDEEPFKPVRAFVTVGDDDEAQPRTFTHIRAAMRDDGLREQVLARARKEVRAWRQRYDGFREFSELFAVIDEVAV